MKKESKKKVILTLSQAVIKLDEYLSKKYGEGKHKKNYKSNAARDLGCSPQYIGKILSGKHKIPQKYITLIHSEFEKFDHNITTYERPV